MGRYRKNPIEIEAVQLRWDTWNEMCDHAGVSGEEGKPHGCYVNESGEAVDEYSGVAMQWLEAIDRRTAKAGAA